MKWIIILFPYLCYSQQVTLKVFNAVSNEAVSYAVVKVNSTGESFITDSTGSVVLGIKNHIVDTLQIFCMGFESRQEVVTDSTAAFSIGLQPKYYIHSGAEIIAFKAATILDKTFAVLKQAQFIDGAHAYYRQFHIENDVPVRFIEADVQLQYNDNAGRVRVNQMRRTLNYEKNGLQHGDHFFDLLQADAARFPMGTIVNASNKNSFLLFAETTDGKHVIRFEEKDKSKELIEYGVLEIEEKTFRLLSYTCKELRNPSVKHEIMSGLPDEYSWDRQESSVVVSYNWKENKIIPVTIQQNYRHHLINRTFKTVDYTVKESFNLYIYKPECSFSADKPELRSSLYGRPYIYDAGFWSKYTHKDHFSLLPDYLLFIRESGADKEFLKAARAQY